MKIASVIEQLGELADELQQDHSFLHEGGIWRETTVEEFKNWIEDKLGDSIKGKLYITPNGLVDKLTFLAPPLMRETDISNMHIADNPGNIARLSSIEWHKNNKMASVLATAFAQEFEHIAYRGGIGMLGIGEYAGVLNIGGFARIGGCQTSNYELSMHGWMRVLNIFKKWKELGCELSMTRLKNAKVANDNQMQLATSGSEPKQQSTGYGQLVIKKAWTESHEDVNASFDKLIAEKLENGLTARTWGWEVEVPNAKEVRAPEGVDKGSDGSLRSYEASDECDCDCDSCYYHECDCEHCETGSSDPDHDCGSSSCTKADMAEYRTTGGVQRTVHSALIKLCEDLNEAEAEMNDTAGTHIHVWAGDLNAKQVANVMAVYRLLQPMFNAIAGRTNVNYSRTLKIETVTEALKGKFKAEKTQDVNVSHLHSGASRKTIEFRQMDCNLDANRIMGWAFMVRGLVTAAKRGLEIKDAIHVATLKDYVELLGRYSVTTASEKPDQFVYGSRTDMNEVSKLVTKLQFA